MPHKIGRMYHEAKTLSPFVGCGFDCAYCRSSFKRQMRRRWSARTGRGCLKCYNYTPHPHMERLRKAPPRVGKGEFVFLVAFGDPAFMKPRELQDVLKYCRLYPDVDFLLQSKDPICFLNLANISVERLPENVIIGTTLETDRGDIIAQLSKAPSPDQRVFAMQQLGFRPDFKRLMVTVEPILKFDLARLVSMITSVKPWRVYVGYDSHPKENKLPEPSGAEAEALVSALRYAGIDVRWKGDRRKAWWE